MTNAEVVEDFFAALEAADVSTGTALLAPDIEWLNTGLPTVRGRGVIRILRALPKVAIEFSMVMHEIEEEGETVRTQRTDVLRWGPLSSSFHVAGDFVVRDGKIHRWDDRYTMSEVLLGFFKKTG
jgi:limonene-1,2-epoxide hydrolase